MHVSYVYVHVHVRVNVYVYSARHPIRACVVEEHSLEVYERDPATGSNVKPAKDVENLQHLR